MESIGSMATKMAAAMGVITHFDAEPLAAESSTQPEQPGESFKNGSEDIAKLAYALWEQRGCPAGSSEQDWIEAEALISSQLTLPGR